MVSHRITKRMMDMQKTTFEVMLNSMSNLQDQSGRAAQAFLEKMSGLPDEGVKSMVQWMDSAKEARNELSSFIREGYDSWSHLFEKRK